MIELNWEIDVEIKNHFLYGVCIYDKVKTTGRIIKK